jgi:hypothetical protein
VVRIDLCSGDLLVKIDFFVETQQLRKKYAYSAKNLSLTKCGHYHRRDNLRGIGCRNFRLRQEKEGSKHKTSGERKSISRGQLDKDGKMPALPTLCELLVRQHSCAVSQNALLPQSIHVCRVRVRILRKATKIHVRTCTYLG